MPSFKEIFPDKWLKAEVINGHRPRVTIEHVGIENLFNPTSRKHEPKLVVKFHDKELRLICNKTQAQALASICKTDDYAKWPGYEVVLSCGKAPNGKDTIIISPLPDGYKPKPPTQAAQAEETTGLDDDEDVVDYEEDNGTSRTVDASTGEITDGDAIPLEGDPRNTRPAPPNDGDALFTPEPRESPPHARLFGQLASGFGPDADAVRPWLIEKWSRKVTPTNTRNSAIELSDDEKDVLADYIKDHLAVVQRAWKNHQASTIQATA